MRKQGSMPAWDDLRFFLSVARLRTLSAAAQHLSVDHTTVARRIERLEKALKARLFERTNVGYDLTPAGESLLAAGEAVESIVANVETRIINRDLSLEGVVRIGAPDGFGSMFLASHLPALCAAHRDLEIELVATARDFSLTKREADIAISLTIPQKGRIVARKLTDYDLGLYASVDYLDRHPAIESRSTLHEHDFISYIDELLFTAELDYLPEVDGNIVARFRSGNLLAQLQACLAGAGLVVLPLFMARQFPQLLRVLPEDVSLRRSFYLQVHEDSRNIARIRAVSSFITELARQHRPLFLGSH
jgi:DNA-binding transcriptional LysR family regulator